MPQETEAKSDIEHFLPLPVMRLTVDIIDQASGTILTSSTRVVPDLTAAWVMTIADLHHDGPANMCTNIIEEVCRDDCKAHTGQQGILQ